MINYVVGGIVAILVVLAIRSLLDKKKDGGGCCGGCSGCSRDCSLNKK
ncbi:MAG: FeoB-associated Cys-rich membrane protein [Acidaminococcaceae bacterium]